MILSNCFFDYDQSDSPIHMLNDNIDILWSNNVENYLGDDRSDKQKSACVYLVGAGPGDAELLTLKAVRLIKQAAVIVYDRLISDEILDMVPAGTTKIFAGKSTGNHILTQDETNQLLLKLARAGHNVVRLKGGDPNIFGRGGEEALFLAKYGIKCEFIPGITAAAGCAAAAGIPLTHRGLAKSVRFVTGHCREDAILDINWQSLADPDTTLAVYMGLANLQTFKDKLITAGLDPKTPVIAIANGTTSTQEEILTILDNMPNDIKSSGFEPPVLTIIGKVAGLKNDLKINDINNVYRLQKKYDEQAIL